MKPDPIARSELLSIKTAVFGLAGISVAFLLHIFGKVPLDAPLRIALYCFVISIPLLVGLGLNLDIAGHQSNPNIPLNASLASMPLWLGPWFTAAGVTSCLWHYEFEAAMTFLGVSVATAIMFGIFQHYLFKSDSDSASGTDPTNSSLPPGKDS